MKAHDTPRKSTQQSSSGGARDMLCLEPQVCLFYKILLTKSTNRCAIKGQCRPMQTRCSCNSIIKPFCWQCTLEQRLAWIFTKSSESRGVVYPTNDRLGYIPGHIHAVWLIYRKMKAEERYGNGGFICKFCPFQITTLFLSLALTFLLISDIGNGQYQPLYLNPEGQAPYYGATHTT